jgi:hypothetical protein
MLGAKHPETMEALTSLKMFRSVWAIIFWLGLVAAGTWVLSRWHMFDQASIQGRALELVICGPFVVVAVGQAMIALVCAPVIVALWQVARGSHVCWRIGPVAAVTLALFLLSASGSLILRARLPGVCA